ncbi:hypothetical protein [Streptosporangium roseum]|uniref:hypothetical protein n=1 Tax=Streptosporangium roseum TaxID=2001 RepID=UPI0033349360
MTLSYALDGEIEIYPPIPLADIDPASPHLPANHAAYMARYDLPMVGLVFRVGALDGVDVATALVPPVRFAYKNAPARELGDILAAHGTGRAFDGEIEEREESGHISTISVVNGHVITTLEDPEDEEPDDDDW